MFVGTSPPASDGLLLLHASGTNAMASPTKIQMAKAEKPRGMRDIVGSFGLTGPIWGSIARSIGLSRCLVLDRKG
jgi:hypothetical protein